jgi:hypothetical protein
MVLLQRFHPLLKQRHRLWRRGDRHWNWGLLTGTADSGSRASQLRHGPIDWPGLATGD